MFLFPSRLNEFILFIVIYREELSIVHFIFELRLTNYAFFVFEKLITFSTVTKKKEEIVIDVMM